MRRFLTLGFLLILALPAGITFSGCYRNPAGNYCNGLGYGLKNTDVYAITLQPSTTGISMAFGQTRQIAAPSAVTCKNTSASVPSYVYGTTNNRLVDISPTGNMCAGTWNRNSGGGIGDYTICQYPSPLPSTGGLPYSVAYITASAASVTSNPVAVYVHAQVSSITLVGPQQCLSQGQLAVLDAQACYSNSGKQVLLCAPSSVTQSASPRLACPLPTVNGAQVPLSSIPSCNSSIGTLIYTAGTGAIASINPITNQITAEQPGTTAITASVAGSGSAAGYFSTCPPKSISITLNGSTSATVTQGAQQNVVTNVTDTAGNSISGLVLDYQSTNPLDISVTAGGAVSALFPGSADVYALCQPGSCNPTPINQVGIYGTGLGVSSNPIAITTPGTASSYIWYAAPGYSQYFVPVSLLNGTVGSTVRIPYVPNSMVMDRTGTSLYFGSSHELMIFSTISSTLSKQDPGVPGRVLAVAPNNSLVLINDETRGVFYLYNPNGTISSTFGGVGVSAQWTPDSKTLYVTDNAGVGPGHSDTLYVFNANNGWTTYPLPNSSGSIGAADCATKISKDGFGSCQDLAIMVPSVGAYLSGDPTVAHTWCPEGNAGAYNNMLFYPGPTDPVPAGDSVNVRTDVVAATSDGNHILGATRTGSSILLSDIGVKIPTDASGSSNCLPPGTSQMTPGPGTPLQPMVLSHIDSQGQVNVSATSVNQIVTSPAAVTGGTSVAGKSLSFITYNGTTAGANLPYYAQTTQSIALNSGFGTIGYIPFAGNAAASITAPVAGAFSPDNTLFFVSTSGDNLIHYIDTTTLTDTQQINLNLPACAPGTDPGCLVTTPISGSVPATAIAVKPRATT